MDIEDIVFNDGTDRRGFRISESQKSSLETIAVAGTDLEEKTSDVDNPRVSEKATEADGTPRTHFSLPRPTLLLFWRRLRRFYISTWQLLPWKANPQAQTPLSKTAITLRRMARTRRLVTSLARLLATKSEVVSQIRKRLLTTSQSGLGNGISKGDGGVVEVAMYMGDVQ